ncbi:MAG: hypothetical protein KF819_07840 [Labilithrix sp.]|nr:hypothetical protein [Labilithrix sp.]
MPRSLFGFVLFGFVLLAFGCSADVVEEEEAAETEDEIVATFDRIGRIDLNKTSRILLVGDSSKLGELPLWSATTRARRYAQLYPSDQIVLFVTKDASSAGITQAGATAVRDEPFGVVALADLKRLSAAKLVAALDRFSRIASLDFFGHSSPFGALLEAEGEDRTLGASAPANIAALADNFARDANPYVTLNGCNGGASTAAYLSKLWRVPVSGALTGTNFQVLMSDGRWYFNDEGFSPPGTTTVAKNERSFGPASSPSCRAGACVRMKPQDAPYRGVWANPDTGFQYGLGYFKFFCDFPDVNACRRGMAASLYAFASIKPIDRRSSDADVKEVLADFFCSGSKDPAWFDGCRAQLFAAAASGAAFSPMRSANDWSHECDFKGCQQKLRCKVVDGAPQKKTCAWVSPACADSQSAASCRPKNTTKQTTNAELARYLEGHRLLRGN